MQERKFGRVLVACEFSGVVRDAFSKFGWDAWSCDLLPSEKPGNHCQCDVREILEEGWDLLVAHPPCTHLAVSGARWFKDKLPEQAAALDFVRLLLAAPIPHIALENPVGIISSHVQKPDQVIQPWQYGHGETKATCLWLKNLPCLAPSNIVEGREQRIWRLPPSADRWKERSRTLSGVAGAMAKQWTAFIETGLSKVEMNWRCAWCDKEAGRISQPAETHGICEKHKSGLLRDLKVGPLTNFPRSVIKASDRKGMEKKHEHYFIFDRCQTCGELQKNEC